MKLRHVNDILAELMAIASSAMLLVFTVLAVMDRNWALTATCFIGMTVVNLLADISLRLKRQAPKEEA